MEDPLFRAVLLSYLVLNPNEILLQDLDKTLRPKCFVLLDLALCLGSNQKDLFLF